MINVTRRLLRHSLMSNGSLIQAVNHAGSYLHETQTDAMTIDFFILKLLFRTELFEF